MNQIPRTLRAGLVLSAALLALTGCSAPGGGAEPATEQQTSQQTAAEAVTIESAWAKAADSGMSAAFGTLVNTSDADVTAVSVASPASPDMELHETVADDSGNMVMRQVEGGFTIPAQGSLLLEPGGNHFMMMSLPKPLRAGDEANFTITFSDGSTLDFTALVKDYSGANEQYDDGSEHGDMDMSGDDSEHAAN